MCVKQLYGFAITHRHVRLECGLIRLKSKTVPVLSEQQFITLTYLTSNPDLVFINSHISTHNAQPKKSDCLTKLHHYYIISSQRVLEYREGTYMLLV